MAIDPLPVWQSTLAALPAVGDTSWALNFANWYADRIVAITTDPAALIPVGFTFPFPVALFATQLQAIAPNPSALAGITAFADAWEAAMLATIPSVSSGSAVPPPSPPTIFSVVISTVLDPAGIAAGKAKIIELAASPPVGDALNSQFPVKFREATLLLTITVTGLDSTPTPAGPLPLVAANVPLV